jgi:hypothetical protein
MKDHYKQQWVELLVKEKLLNWRFSMDHKHIVAFVPADVDLDEAMLILKRVVTRLKGKVKGKPESLGFFVGNERDSRFWEFDAT